MWGLYKGRCCKLGISVGRGGLRFWENDVGSGGVYFMVILECFR